MQPHLLVILGLAIDILGAFLVTAEAMRIENLKKLQASILRWLRTFLTIFGSNRHLPGDDIPVRTYIVLIIGSLYILAIIYFWPETAFSKFFSVAWTKTPSLYDFGIFILAVISWGLLAVLLTHGSIVLLLFPIIVLIYLITWLDRNTSSGTVGIIGFFLLFIGFLLQMIGTYFAANT